MKNTFAVKTSLFTLILALIAIGTFAFTAVMNKTIAPATIQNTFHYIGDSEAPNAFSDVSNWEQGGGDACGFEGNKPCQITVEANDLSELQDYLSGMDNNTVLSLDDSRRP